MPRARGLAHTMDSANFDTDALHPADTDAQHLDTDTGAHTPYYYIRYLLPSFSAPILLSRIYPYIHSYRATTPLSPTLFNSISFPLSRCGNAQRQGAASVCPDERLHIISTHHHSTFTAPPLSRCGSAQRQGAASVCPDERIKKSQPLLRLGYMDCRDGHEMTYPGQSILLRVRNGAGLADNGDFHLSGVRHFVLNLLCYVVRKALRLLI